MQRQFGIMEEKQSKMRKEFLSVTPLQRITRMNQVFNHMIALKAKTLESPNRKSIADTLKLVGCFVENLRKIIHIQIALVGGLDQV